MTAAIHDDEPDTSPQVVRALLREQFREVAALPVDRLSNTGSDNVLYRLGTEFIVRLPRTARAARSLGVELDWLPRLTGLPVRVPEVVHAGGSSDDYPYRWAVLRWLDGVDAWEARHQLDWFGPDLGHDLAAVVRQLRCLPASNDLPVREVGQRGGPLDALDAQVRRWLDRADGLVDVHAVTSLWEQCLEGADDTVEPTVVHGDLIPGNLLLDDARLTAVLDWGSVGVGDPAQDLIPAWSVLNDAGATAFREDLSVDEPSWLRACGFALEQAIGGVIYYTPRQHPLGDVMRRTLERLLRR